MPILKFGVLCYMIYAYHDAITSDLDDKFRLYTKKVQDEIDICTRNYAKNMCDHDTRTPMLEEKCNQWDWCMNQDPWITARRAEWISEILADTITTFVERLSWKAVLFVILFMWDRVLLSVGFARAAFFGSANTRAEKDEERHYERHMKVE